MANLALGVVIMLVCLFVQALIVLWCVRFYAARQRLLDSPGLLSTFGMISAVMLILVLGNFIQIATWAAVFIMLGEFSDINTAVYHSAVNFATLGYGDIVMSEKHRILGPMESINGVLMVGVSTAVVMSAIQHALQRIKDARLH